MPENRYETRNDDPQAAPPEVDAADPWGDAWNDAQPRVASTPDAARAAITGDPR